jgi:dipicolinate synthase subunit A
MRAGYAVGGDESIARADYILLPLPLDAERAGLAGLLRAAKPGALALGGKVSPPAYEAARAAGIELVDYFAREELTVLNAIPTAEGCIELLLRRSQRTLCGTPVLVVGFGHVGRALAPRLAALGAPVTVAARSPAQRAEARSMGLAAADTARLQTLAARFDTVVNTAPAPLLTQAVLCALPPRSLIVDLASRPGGTDFAAAQALGHTALHALSLPASCAPESAGEYVAHTVLAILAERAEETNRKGDTQP